MDLSAYLPRFLPVLAIAAAAMPCAAQRVLREHLLPQADLSVLRAYHIQPVDDLDGDGVVDYFISYEYGSVQGLVETFSGATGEKLWSYRPPLFASRFGRYADAAGDHDGDGVEDIVVGAIGETIGGVVAVGRVRVLSGVDGRPIATVDGCCENGSFGWHVAGVGDVNGDGFDDFLAGRNDQVQLFLGPDATPDRIHPYQPALKDGVQQVEGLGDVDGDGRPDYLIAEPWYNGQLQPRVRLFSGASGEVLWTGGVPQALIEYGHSVAGVGDIDGDGVQDFGVSIRHSWHVSPYDSVVVYSGATREELFGIPLTRYESVVTPGRGRWVTGGEDVNGDGVPDVIEGAGEPYPGSTSPDWDALRVVSGATGEVLWRLWEDFPADLELIGPASMLGDLDGDGYAEWAALYYGDVVARIFRGGPGEVLRTCPAAVNSSGESARLSSPWGVSVNASHLRLLVEGLPAGEPGIFFYGQPGPSTPFGDGVLCTGAEYFRMAAPVQSVAAGAAWLDVDLATAPMNGAGGTGALQAGSTWRFQYWYRDSQGPTGTNLSDALDVTFTQ